MSWFMGQLCLLILKNINVCGLLFQCLYILIHKSTYATIARLSGVGDQSPSGPVADVISCCHDQLGQSSASQPLTHTAPTPARHHGSSARAPAASSAVEAELRLRIDTVQTRLLCKFGPE